MSEPVPFLIGGAGGAYFLATPGELTIELEKRDRHEFDRRTDLRAVLTGPDRRPIQDVTIPDDGGPLNSGLGEPGRVLLKTTVEQPGIYVLNITLSNDRYGQEVVWGFRTNCPKYLIETSRGHKDEAHQEPIVLHNPGKPCDVCFVPRDNEFQMEVTDLPAGARALTMLDAAGTEISSIPVGGDGCGAFNFPAGEHRDSVPWRLHFPDQPAVLNMDGLTRWDTGERSENLCLWTPDISSYFPFVDDRWLLTPYHRVVYGDAGEKGEVSFLTHNNASEPRTLLLALEAAEGDPIECALPREAVDLAPGEAIRNAVTYTVPGKGKSGACRFRVTPAGGSGFTTYSTLVVTEGAAPAASNLQMPIVLGPYTHENEQFGYLPDYPTENEVYFDVENRPYVQAQEGLATLRDNGWDTTVLRDGPGLSGRGGVISTYRGRSSKVAFDRENDVYLLSARDGDLSLFRSRDNGRTFSDTPLGAGRAAARGVDIEVFTGHNVPEGPPPVIRYCQTAGHDSRFRWRSLNDLELFLPEKSGDGLSLGDPIRLSDQSLSAAQHSGTPPAIASCGSKVHVVWGEATDHGADVPGVPMYVASYDRETGKLGEPVFLAYGPPPNDGHNTPAITVDSQGYLHIVGGTHGAPFPYVRSLQPNDAYSGWTEPEPASGGRQTYIGLLCGPDDTLYMVFRAWWGGTDYFAAGNYGTLSLSRKKPGQAWEECRQLVVPPFSEYSVYYHRLTIDRNGRLFISYNQYCTYHFYRNDHVGNRRALIMSPDGGETWKLVQTSDFRA